MFIESTKENCTVIVTVSGEKEYIESIIDHATNGLSKFNQFVGFIAGATHVSDGNNKIIQYLQWTNKEAYRNCVNDPSWEDLESSKLFIELMKSSLINVDVQTYEVVKSIN